MIAAGLVMTGGASRIEGAEELAEELFHMPVRLATPRYVTGLSDVVSNAIHATGVGLGVGSGVSFNNYKRRARGEIKCSN